MPIARYAIFIVVAWIVGACTSPPAQQPPVQTSQPTATPSPAPQPTSTPSPTAAPRGVYVSPGLPADLISRVDQAIAAAPAEFVRVPETSTASVLVSFDVSGALPAIGRRVYALVAAFATITDEVTWTDVRAAWEGSPDHGPLRMTQATYDALRARFGEAAAGAIEVLEPNEIADALWAAPGRAAWGIVPFDELDVRLKVLYVDGLSPLRRNLDLSAYPLSVEVVLSGDLTAAAEFQSAFGAPYTNRDESRMTVLALTGVTALTRDLGLVMDREGAQYPAEQIRPWLEEADILHISNEVSFTPDCQIVSGTVVFCSRPEYFDLLTGIGVDVIENTGNHMNDWGRQPFSYTLGLFNQAGIPYYGGGYNLVDAARPITIENHGNLIGFVGCNPNGQDVAWATETEPGSFPCRLGGGMDFGKVQPQIDALRAEGALPVFTIQYWEFDSFSGSLQQAAEFRKAAELGAAIVSGSQAHHVQGFDFRNGAVIAWGPGNLFFDQTQLTAMREGMIDRYIIYHNRVLSLEILTFIRDLDNYAQPRPMPPSERANLLQTLFTASGW